MIICKNHISLFIICFCFVQSGFTQSGRLENEFKLAVPNDEVTNVWKYILDTYGKPTFHINDLQLSGQQSVEVFKDTYFDNDDQKLKNLDIGLRYRKRYKDDILLKELIQLKTPFSSDKVVRNEIKFEVKNSRKATELKQRHPLLKYLSHSDIKRLNEELATYKIKAEQLKSSLKLIQKRSRIYISDIHQESVATITLDEVKNTQFPFQNYAEMELELNEIRYTNADINEQKRMEKLNAHLQTTIMNQFENLKIDQRPKYNKMVELIDGNWLSSIRQNWTWSIFGALVIFAVFHYLKYHIIEA